MFVSIRSISHSRYMGSIHVKDAFPCRNPPWLAMAALMGAIDVRMNGWVGGPCIPVLDTHGWVGVIVAWNATKLVVGQVTVASTKPTRPAGLDSKCRCCGFNNKTDSVIPQTDLSPFPVHNIVRPEFFRLVILNFHMDRHRILQPLQLDRRNNSIV